MRRFSVLLLLTTALFGKLEIIELSAGLDSEVLSTRWIRLALGGMYIDEQFVYLAHENTMYIQKRDEPSAVTKQDITMNGSGEFTIMRVLPTEKQFYFSLILRNGRFYLGSAARDASQSERLIEKHGYPGRLLWQNEVFYASGVIWYEHAKYLDKYANYNGDKPTESNLKEFKRLFEEQKGFTLSIYDVKLNRIDSLNVLSRTGENAYGFYNLYTPQPFDMTKDGDIFLVDNERGYLVEKWGPNHVETHDFVVANANYKPIPDQLTDETSRELKQSHDAYSCCYALYEKGSYIITAFYTAVPPPGDYEPPFYYDVSTKDGSLVYSGSSPYPLVSEDEDEQVYFYKKAEGGWFEDDRVFLVGMSVRDVINGRATRENIEKELERILAE